MLHGDRLGLVDGFAGCTTPTTTRSDDPEFLDAFTRAVGAEAVAFGMGPQKNATLDQNVIRATKLEKIAKNRAAPRLREPLRRVIPDPENCDPAAMLRDAASRLLGMRSFVDMKHRSSSRGAFEERVSKDRPGVSAFETWLSNSVLRVKLP